MLIALDIGNTRAKVAVMTSQDDILHHWTLGLQGLSEGLEQHLKVLPAASQVEVGWISTAGDMPLEAFSCWEYFEQRPRFFPITALSPLPVALKYLSPETLGADRITAIVAACSHSPGHPVLVIDAGTAITYDVADAAGNYLGGGISPGVRMRFRALHEFTARLPQVEPEGDPPLIGEDTAGSIRSGVINGAVAEVKGIVARYQVRFGPELMVFLTGGDREFFEKSLKKLNFAGSNLVPEGIYLIVQHNISL